MQEMRKCEKGSSISKLIIGWYSEILWENIKNISDSCKHGLTDHNILFFIGLFAGRISFTKFILNDFFYHDGLML